MLPDCQWHSISAESFRIRLAALIDIYSVLSQVSKGVQDTQKLPWERQQSVTSAVSSMEEMARGLSDKVAASSSARRQPQLDSAGIQRQLEETSSAEFAELWPKLDNLLERATLPPEQVCALLLHFERIVLYQISTENWDDFERLGWF